MLSTQNKMVSIAGVCTYLFIILQIVSNTEDNVHFYRIITNVISVLHV